MLERELLDVKTELEIKLRIADLVIECEKDRRNIPAIFYFNPQSRMLKLGHLIDELLKWEDVRKGETGCLY